MGLSRRTQNRMALPQTNAANGPIAAGQRRHYRVRVNLLGRYMLADRREFPCQVSEMSPGELEVIATAKGQIGERVICYVDHIGRVEGVITHLNDDGFGMTVATTTRKRDKIAAQLTWLANRHILNLPEDRRHERFEPRVQSTRLILPDGTEVICRVIDLSESGVALRTDKRPEIGASVTVGKIPGRVVRKLDDGFAVEFTRLQHRDLVEDSVTGG